MSTTADAKVYRMKARQEPDRTRRLSVCYGLAIELDEGRLAESADHPPPAAARQQLRRELEARGFACRQNGLFVGSADIRSKECIKAIMDIGAKLPWFRRAVADIRMLQIAEDDSLMDFLAYQPLRGPS